jgi:hypothetical protein
LAVQPHHRELVELRTYNGAITVVVVSTLLVSLDFSRWLASLQRIRWGSPDVGLSFNYVSKRAPGAGKSIFFMIRHDGEQSKGMGRWIDREHPALMTLLMMMMTIGPTLLLPVSAGFAMFRCAINNNKRSP